MEKDTPPKNSDSDSQDFKSEPLIEIGADTENTHSDAVIFAYTYIERAKNLLRQLSTAPLSRGGNAYKEYLKTGKTYRTAAILAKCCECSGLYYDGRVDCGCQTCPLYPFMPYREHEKYVRPDRK